MSTIRYTCPMHPDIVTDAPGTCPICGMPLVEHNAADTGAVTLRPADAAMLAGNWKDYLPLVTVLGVIALSAAALTWRDFGAGAATWRNTAAYVMAGFFLAFSTFKLLDVRGFAHAYATYDLLAMRVPAYGYAYPFIELTFGLLMLAAPHSRPLLAAEAAVMAFSGIGVAVKIAKREKFRCACLGTVLKVPLTTVTLIEDFGMAALALVLLAA